MVCFDKFKQPCKKLDRTIDIPYNLDDLNTFGQIEEEILSCDLSKKWGQIEISLICYQKTTNAKADHFNLKSNSAINAFVIECKKIKSIQLCVYSANQTKRKQIL